MVTKRFYLSSLALAAAALLPLSASASFTFNAALTAPAQGFGTAPRDLTLQANGQTSFESGAVNYLGAAGIGFGTPIADSLVHDGNGVTNVTGTAAMPNPLADDQKYGVPTAGSLGNHYRFANRRALQCDGARWRFRECVGRDAQVS